MVRHGTINNLYLRAFVATYRRRLSHKRHAPVAVFGDTNNGDRLEDTKFFSHSPYPPFSHSAFPVSPFLNCSMAGGVNFRRIKWASTKI